MGMSPDAPPKRFGGIDPNVSGPSEYNGADEAHTRPELLFHSSNRRHCDRMIIAVQPPTYFPSLPYTALLRHVDQFVLADTFRFRPNTFQNRSKLRNARGGHWITIPVFGHPAGAPIHTVDLEAGGRWREKHWRSFMYDYRTTMYFEFYEETFRPFFDVEWTNLAECTCRSVELQVELFGIDTELVRTSNLSEKPATIDEIISELGADTLVVPASDAPDDVEAADVEVFSYEHPTYRQNFEGFESGMSAMDLLFNYGREAERLLAQGERSPRSTA